MTVVIDSFIVVTHRYGRDTLDPDPDLMGVWNNLGVMNKPFLKVLAHHLEKMKAPDCTKAKVGHFAKFLYEEKKSELCSFLEKKLDKKYINLNSKNQASVHQELKKLHEMMMERLDLVKNYCEKLEQQQVLRL